MSKQVIYSFFLIFLISVVSAAEIDSYVVDNAKVFSAETRQYLNDALIELEQKTNGVQIVVFTEENIPSGTTLEERSLKIAENNGIGKAEYDNGLLFYLATKDREYRWEVGYGLEPVLNSAWLGRTSRDFMVPKFQSGDFEGGILAGLAEVEDKLLNSNETASGIDSLSPASDNAQVYAVMLFIISALVSNGFFFVIVLFLIISIIKFFTRKKTKYKDDNYYNSSASTIFSGRGGFGGSGGGFSGGGGSFGGGGFSGRF